MSPASVLRTGLLRFLALVLRAVVSFPIAVVTNVTKNAMPLSQR